MRRFVIFILFFIFCFISCVSVEDNSISLTKRKQFSIPDINVETTCSIGDELIKQGECTIEWGVYASIPKKNGSFYYGFFPYYESAEKTITQKKGKYKEIIGKQKTSIYKFKDSMSVRIGNIYSPHLEYVEAEKKLYFQEYMENKTEIEDFKFGAHISNKETSFQKTLVYLGKSGKLLRFGYREYFENFARPSFSNEITYDMNESNIIGYKKLRIQVISATNSAITYKILNTFDNDFNSDIIFEDLSPFSQ